MIPISDRIIKNPEYWNILLAFRRITEVKMGEILTGSQDPPKDIVALWSRDTDLGYARYNQELAFSWGAFKRMGYQVVTTFVMTSSWESLPIFPMSMPVPFTCQGKRSF